MVATNNRKAQGMRIGIALKPTKYFRSEDMIHRILKREL